MDALAGQTGDRLIAIIISGRAIIMWWGRVVSSPTLNAKAGVGAAKQKGGHEGGHNEPSPYQF